MSSSTDVGGEAARSGGGRAVRETSPAVIGPQTEPLPPGGMAIPGLEAAFSVQLKSDDSRANRTRDAYGGLEVILRKAAAPGSMSLPAAPGSMSLPVGGGGLAGPVQRRLTVQTGGGADGAARGGQDGDGAASIQQAAARGVQTPTSTMPFLDQLQPLFGGHDIGGIQAHVGDEAGSSAQAMGARAYATGDHVVFAGTPDLHTAAHEAAHVVQQRGGVHLAGGVGQAGDAYERHADAVADRVVAGEPVETLLDAFAGSSAGRQEATGAGGVQRAIENATYDEEMDKARQEDATAARAFFEAFELAVQEAYRFLVGVPSLGGLAGLNGHTALWCEKWEEYLAGGKPSLMAASFGYVIESLVSSTTTGYRPAAPAGYTILTQVSVGGTRPDLVLARSSTLAHAAWLDLTASGSADHIFDKEGWSDKVRNFAEVTYPSMDLTTLALMKQNKDAAGPVSAAEFEKRLEAAQKERAEKKAQWREVGKGLTVTALKSEIPGNQMVWGLDPTIRQKFIHDKLLSVFGAQPDFKMVPSVLEAMGVSSSSWDFGMGFSASEAAGEAWLIDNCPALT